MAAAAARFVPRDSFAIPSSIPKTYFLGHHAAGASKIKDQAASTRRVPDVRVGQQVSRADLLVVQAASVLLALNVLVREAFKNYLV